jgi:hypothetical protein
LSSGALRRRWRKGLDESVKKSGDPTDLAGYLKSEVWQELRLRSAIMHVLLGGADIYYLLDTRGMPQFLILTMPKLSRS